MDLLYVDGDEDGGIPIGWEHVELGDELDAFCDAAGRGDMDTVNEIVGRAYARAYARLGGRILEGEEQTTMAVKCAECRGRILPDGKHAKDTGCRARACVVCGCTDARACLEGCSWASLNPPICSTHDEEGIGDAL